MSVHSETIKIDTDGDGHCSDITSQLQDCVAASGLTDGVVTLFIAGSTAGLTTIEYEPGAVADLDRLFQEIVPRNRDYRHHQTWGCDNGHSHVRAALLGPSLSIPFTGGTALLGTWQQVILVDFDTRPRKRAVYVQLMGE